MNTVKPLKSSNLSQKQNRSFLFLISSLPIILFSMVIGTYLDLYFVGKGLYSFPTRPWPDIFTIHVPFTLFGLPFLVTFFLIISRKLAKWNVFILSILLALMMSIFERFAENLGVFEHHIHWRHVYSIVGYTLFFSFIYVIHQLLTGKIKQYYQ